MIRTDQLGWISNISDRLRLSTQLQKNALSGGILALGNLALILVSYPIYLTYLGTEWYGLWATLSVVIAFGQMGNIGIANAVARHVAEALGRKADSEARSFIGASLVLIAPPCLLLIVITSIFSTEISNLLALNEPFSSVAREILPMIGVLSASILVIDILRGVLVGVGKMDSANYMFLAARVVQFGSSVGLLASGAGVLGLLYGASAGYFVLGASYGATIFRHLGTHPVRIFGFSLLHVKALLNFGAYMFSSNLISMLMDPFNKLILARYTGLDTVTFYEIGIRGVQAVRSIYEGAIKALLPRVSELSGQGEGYKETIRRIHGKSLRLVTTAALPVFSGLFLFSHWILQVWLDTRYSDEMSFVFRWFLVGYMVNLFSVPSFYVLLGLDRAKYCFYGAALRSVFHFSVILAVLLSGWNLDLTLVVAVHNFSMIGAALFIMSMYHRTMNGVPASAA